jgi:hypothetical protein
MMCHNKEYYDSFIGQTSYLIHAKGSSFAKEAAALHMIKLVDVSDSKFSPKLMLYLYVINFQVYR